MKKIALLTLIVAAFASCKKDNNSSTPSISITNASLVSAALNVWHGTNTNGTPPSGTNNGSLSIDLTSQSITSYKGGYIVITPTVFSGTVAGYYLHVTGADNYFKIDYSNNIYRPAITASARPALGIAPHHKQIPFGLRPASVPAAPNDSLIVIQLPAGIDTGTFCMEYWAYDNYGNISDSVQVCITVDQLGASSGGSWAGNWVLSGYKLSSQFDNGASGLIVDTTWKYNIYDTTNILDYVLSYYCVDGHLSDDSGYYHGYDIHGFDTLIQGSSTSALSIPEYMFYSGSMNLTLSSNGAWQSTIQSFGQVYRSFNGNGLMDLRTASCSDRSYTDTTDNASSTGSTTGGWSYNATTNMFIVMSKDSGGSAETTTVDQYLVESKTSTTFILAATDSASIGFKLQFTKQ
jgi:hypothetical protein